MASWERQSHYNELDRNGQAPSSESDRPEICAIPEIIMRQWMDGFGSYIEPLLRKVVREETHSALQRHLSRRRSLNQVAIFGGRGRALQLHFIKKLPREIFTLSKVVAEDKTLLQITLCDAGSQHCIVKDGDLSSIKIELCVLNGEFGPANGKEDWTAEEFNANILCERENKRPLLIGDRVITLKNGVGYITSIQFTDISRWAKSGKFRLGAKLVESTSDGANIREGISEAFKVKDNRGESYQKHDIPSLNDEVWRLKKIAKNGKRHKLLQSHGIQTVNDLLQLHNTSPHLLKQKIGKIGTKSWEALIDHANACAMQENGNCYIKQTAQLPKVGQPYLPVGSLNSEHEPGYHDLQAGRGLQQDHSLTAHQDLCNPSPSTSTSHIGEAVPYGQAAFAEVVPSSSGGGEFVPELPHIDDHMWACLFELQSSDDGGQCGYHYSYPNAALYMSSKGRGTTFGDKIRNVLKLVIFSLTKRKAKLYPHDH